MGEAREAMDRITGASVAGDAEAIAACYAEDAVAITPDEGEVRGREAIARYLLAFSEPFPDSDYEYLSKFEDGDTAIDEGYLTGTHTGVLRFPNGDTVEPTGRKIRVRSVDIALVSGGLITSHHFYFDQMEFLLQLGLAQPTGSA
jgi:ketosteroid isomerase-like protein